MKLSEALAIVMGDDGIWRSDYDRYQAQLLMTGHLKQLVKREEGRKDTELTEVQVYQEHHHQNVCDIGVAFNEDRVWVCIDGVSLFRAKAVGTRMFTEYYGR
jgi:hypothetical protein